MPVVKTCPECHKEFPIPPSREAKYTFCSIECKRHATPRRQCDKCGKEFTVKKSKVDTGRGKYCSKACWSERANWKISECPICHKKTRVRENDKRRYCSYKCHGMHLAQTISGENSVHWKGGHEDARGANWRQQRKLARKRDGYKCQNCGKTQKQNGRSLDVHHIRPFRTFDNYEEANELSNLISLCMSCHGKAENGLIPIHPKLI